MFGTLATQIVFWLVEEVGSHQIEPQFDRSLDNSRKIQSSIPRQRAQEDLS